MASEAVQARDQRRADASCVRSRPHNPLGDRGRGPSCRVDERPRPGTDGFVCPPERSDDPVAVLRIRFPRGEALQVGAATGGRPTVCPTRAICKIVGTFGKADNPVVRATVTRAAPPALL